MIITNADFKKSHAQGAHSEFYPVANISKQDDGSIQLNFKEATHVVIRDKNLREIYMIAAAHEVPNLITRAEFQCADNKNIPQNNRLVTLGSFITIRTPQGVFSPVLKRNGNIIESGKFTYPSGLLSESPQTGLWREVNEELGIIANGQIVFVNPTRERHMDDIIQSYKILSKSRNQTLKDIFANYSSPKDAFLKVPAIPLYPKIRTEVTFSGIYSGTMNLVAIDNPDTHTLHLIDPVQIDLRDKKDIKVFDPEHLGRDTDWIDLNEDNDHSMDTTYALSQYLKKISLALA